MAPVRFDVEDEDRVRADEGLAVLFLPDVFRPEDFLADDERVADFFAGDFLSPVFFADVFLLEARFGGELRFDDDLFAFRLRSRARAVPPTTAPSAAAPVAANIGFSATVLATFFAPVPTAETASPAFSTTTEIVERPSFNLSVGSLRAMSPPPC